MKTFADNVLEFNKYIHFEGKLPGGIRVLNPFKDNREILSITELFYRKFYNDTRKRRLILGINPGRYGAGATGIPFTDTKRLSEICSIEIDSIRTHEPSSVFVYEAIERYGGVKKFYGDFYINSICPLGFVEKNKKGNWVNCNYYDYPELFSAVRDFITTNLKMQVNFGIHTNTCYVLGRKNVKYFNLINDKEKLFKSVVVLDHPRYIQQYRSRDKEGFIIDYLNKLRNAR
jgi:hypothetical protein